MSLGHFILGIFSNVWSFLSDRARKEYLYLFKKGARISVGDAERGNVYVNEIVEHFITEAHEYNPYIIEDKIYTWLRIPLIVEVEHLETFIEGFINLYKEKSCQLTEKCGRLHITANLGAGPLHFTICAWGKLLNIEQLITITASLNHCKGNADFSLNAKTGRNGRLHSLCIEEFTDVKICIAITGFRHLSWFLSKLFTLMTRISHRVIRNLVEFELEHYVSKLFPVCQFPIEGRSVNSFSEDRSALSQVEEKSFKCSKTNICGKSSFNNVSTTSNAISRKAAESSSIKSGKQIIDNTNIHNIADCSKEFDNKVEKKAREKQFGDSEVSSELERDSCCANIPLLQENDISQETETSNKLDDNIQIDIAFSNDANMGDVDALSKLNSSSFVFVKYENENLQKRMLEETNYFPSKHYERFFKSFMKPNEESEVGATSKFTDQLDESVLPDENVSKNKSSMNSFFKEYPKFIALTHKCEEQKLEVTRPSFEYNSSSKRNQSGSKITLEKDNVNVSLSSESRKITFNPETEVVKCGELLNSKVICALPADKRGPSIDIVKNVDSILRWTSDSDDTEESKSYVSKKYRSHSYISKPYVPHQNDCSNLTEFLDKHSKISDVKQDWTNSKEKQKSIFCRSTKSNIHCTDRNVEKSILNNSTILQREHDTDTIVKTTDPSNEQHFENPRLVTIPQSTFFFEDNESVAVSNFTYANKQHESELAKQPGLLNDIIAKRIGKDVDRTIDLDYILNKTETIFTTQNKKSQPTTWNSSVKQAAASSDSCTISQVVKNYFEQNPIDNRLLRKNILLTISDVSENEQSFSCSSNVDFSGVLNDKLFYLISDTDKKSHDLFGVEMFNVDTLYSCSPTEMTKDNVKRSPYDRDDLSASLDWGSYLMFSDPGSISSNSVMLNVSSEKSPNFRVLTENAYSETAPKITSFTKIKTDADGSCYDKMNVNNDLSAKCDASGCETFYASQSTTSNPNSDKRLELNSKISSIENLDLSYPLNETSHLARVKQVALNEENKAELDETHKTVSHRILIELLKVTKKADECDCLESINVSEAAYDRIHADILLLLAEDSIDVSFEKEDSVLGMTDQFSFPRTDIDESRMSYTDVAEEFHTADHIKYHKESLPDYCCVGTLDVFTEIEDELEYISEQTKQLEVMFKNFDRHRGAYKMNPSTDSSPPYRESSLRNFQGPIFKHEDTDDTKYLGKENEFLVKAKGESCGCISDTSVQEKSPSQECELVNVEGGLLSGDITDPEMHSLTKDNTPLVKVKDKSYGWDSSKQSNEGKKFPWEECKIVNGEGRVSWKRAMQIWGVGKNSLFYPDLELCNAQARGN